MLSLINNLKPKILEIVNKSDDVNEADLAISQLFKDYCSKEKILSKYHFYSEEQLGNHLNPPIIILDPIDGTKEFRQKIDECCVSFSILNSLDLNDKSNFHWIWNFFNDDEFIFSEGKLVKNISNFQKFEKKKKYLTFLSKTDFKKYDLKNFEDPEIQIEPVGSIAYKLALMLNRKCDFIISLTNKNIWDICAGSMMLSLNNSKMYLKGEIQKSTFNSKLEIGPMYWIPSDLESEILEDLIKKILRRNKS